MTGKLTITKKRSIILAYRDAAPNTGSYVQQFEGFCFSHRFNCLAAAFRIGAKGE